MTYRKTISERMGIIKTTPWHPTKQRVIEMRETTDKDRLSFFHLFGHGIRFDQEAGEWLVTWVKEAHSAVLGDRGLSVRDALDAAMARHARLTKEK